MLDLDNGAGGGVGKWAMTGAVRIAGGAIDFLRVARQVPAPRTRQI
jgi:hypothetical protein